jgi:hypothetical protein
MKHGKKQRRYLIVLKLNRKIINGLEDIMRGERGYETDYGS